jgi:hypothetical protein
MSNLFIKIPTYVHLQAIKARRPRNQNLIPFWENDVSLLQKAMNRCGPTQLRIERVPVDVSAERRGRGLQIDDKPPPSAENTCAWNYAST